MLSKLAVYLPASNAWTGVTTAASDTWSPGSEAEYLDGSIYVWRGGFAGGAVNGSDSYLDVCNIASNSWSRTPSLLNSGVMPGFRAGGFDVWGISLSADPIHHRLFVIGAESNHQLYIFDIALQTWTVGPAAPYDGGWGASLEYVSAADRLYQIDGRNSTAAPQGSAVLLRFNLSAKFQSPSSINLIWPAAAGHNYQAQFKTNLTQPGWLNLGGAITATNSTMTTTDAIGQSTPRYYRVLFQP